jgi:hypothetical protein
VGLNADGIGSWDGRRGEEAFYIEGEGIKGGWVGANGNCEIRRWGPTGGKEVVALLPWEPRQGTTARDPGRKVLDRGSHGAGRSVGPTGAGRTDRGRGEPRRREETWEETERPLRGQRGAGGTCGASEAGVAWW